MSFSILSLDGGGTWALIQARVLEQRYGANKSGHEILKEYDLVIANSGGSLVLALLCANKTVKEIIDTFNDVTVLQSIFKKKFVAALPGLKKFFPNYETANKYEVFRKHLQKGGVNYGDTLLPDLPALIGKPELQIIITNFDYDRERAVYWRSNKQSKMEGAYIEQQTSGVSAPPAFKTVTLAQAVHGASNAPVQFFDDPAAFPITTIKDGQKETGKNRLFWDGAVGGNNNPVKSGVLEALANAADRKKLLEEIRIVSIGTAATVLPVLYDEDGECKAEYDWLCRYSHNEGWDGDLNKMANSIIADPPDASSFDTHQILGLPLIQNDARFIRINPMVKPLLKTKNGNPQKAWYMPGREGAWTEKEMKDLFELDMAVSTEYGLTLINRLCEDYFNGHFDNQGIRIGGEKMEAILGHKKFEEAMKDWKGWSRENAIGNSVATR